ncbi:MAG: hypothetical protein IJT59_06030 [Desulfovibrionaceae bacterium]|nr:hypothetical protein [Desulfovibrionaceae bacterium]
MVAKLGSDEAKVVDSQYSPRTSSAKPAPKEIIARGELLAAYAAGHFLKLSFQSQKDDGLRQILEKVAELPVQAKTINNYLDELHEFYESTGISNLPRTWLTLEQLRSVGLAEPHLTSKTKQNISFADSKTPADLVTEGVFEQAEYWPAPTY